jgi:hypothetical protein
VFDLDEESRLAAELRALPDEPDASDTESGLPDEDASDDVMCAAYVPLSLSLPLTTARQ